MGGEKKTKQAQTQTSNIDPYFQTLQQQNYDRVVAHQPQYNQPYQGQLSTSFNGTPLGQAQSGFSDLAGYRAPSIGGMDLSKYTNPYDTAVVNSTMSDLARQYGIDSTGANAQATSAGAFGGSRSGVLSGLVNDNYQRNLNSTVSGLRQAGYNQAQGMAQQDVNNDIASAGIRGNANTALTNIAGMQNGADSANIMRAYQAWLDQQRNSMTGQQLTNASLFSMDAPRITTGSGESTTSENPGLGKELGQAAQLAAMFM